MTEVSEKEFLNKLLEVVYKLSSIAKTQSYRFKKKWEDYLQPFNKNPHLVRQIPLDKDKFLKDIDYRIAVLKNLKGALNDGLNSIQSLLHTLYKSYFDSELFKNDFSAEDQLILKYLVAKEILGNLIQYNKIDHETVPLKYNILARNYIMLKLKDQSDTEILDSLEKLNISEINSANLNEYMDQIKNDGIINIEKEKESYIYKLNKTLELSTEGKLKYGQTLQSLIDWPTLFWRSFYNIRELNVTLDAKCRQHEFITKTLVKSATQGYIPTNFVITNLIKYYEMIKE
jgi:hypothetical protein